MQAPTFDGMTDRLFGLIADRRRETYKELTVTRSIESGVAGLILKMLE